MATSFLISGATGKQGRSTILALLAHPSFSPSTHTIYALTRDTSSKGARALASRSPTIKLVQGDLNDAAAIFSSLPTAPTGVFSVQVPGKGEVKQGVGLATEASKAGVRRFVQTGVDRGGEGPSIVPHFITKYEIEREIEALAAANPQFGWTMLRPVCFMDSFDWGFIGKVVATAWRDQLRPGQKLQVVDTRDIGLWAAEALVGDELRGRKISLAGDELSFADADRQFRELTGKPLPVTYGWLARLIVWMVNDVKLMFKFFRDTGFSADVKSLNEKKHMATFKEWVQQSKYMNAKSS